MSEDSGFILVNRNILGR